MGRDTVCHLVSAVCLQLALHLLNAIWLDNRAAAVSVRLQNVAAFNERALHRCMCRHEPQ